MTSQSSTSIKATIEEAIKIEEVITPSPDYSIYSSNIRGINYDYLGDSPIYNYYLILYLDWLKTRQCYNPIFLERRQIFNVNRLYAILNEYGKALDISHTGAGKSYCVAVLSIMLRLPIAVISTKNVEPSWDALRDRNYTGIDKIKFYSLNKLAGTVRKLPTGKGEEILKGVLKGKGKNSYIKYEPGKKLKSLVEKGYLFVFDEVHSCKNVNNFTHIVGCITDYVQKCMVRNGTRSKCIYMSATLSDKKDIGPIMYAMGFTNDPELGKEGSDHEKSSKSFVKLNKEIDYDNTKSIRKYIDDKYEDNPKAKNKMLIRRLFIRNIMPLFCSYVSMEQCEGIPLMIKVEFKPKIQYRMYKLNINRGFDDIIRGAAKKIIGGRKKKSMEVYNQLIKVFNYCSIIPVIGSAIDKLIEKPDCKVVIYSNVITFNEKESVIKFISKHIKEKLLENKIKISCATLESSDKNRADIIEKFRDNKMCRLFVSSPDVGGTGISLDDVLGNERRYVFVIPNHRADTFRQTQGRFCRQSTKSDSKIVIPICIGNDLKLPEEYDEGKAYVFKNLKQYEKVIKVKDLTLEQAGKKPNGNLNYSVIKRMNEKSKSLLDFDANTLMENIGDIPCKFYNKAKYPDPYIYEDEYSKEKLPKVYRDILKGII